MDNNFEFENVVQPEQQLPDETPKKKLNVKLMFGILVPVIAVLVLAAVMFLPLLQNPWEGTFSALFVDASDMDKFADALFKNGVGMEMNASVSGDIDTINAKTTVFATGKYKGQNAIMLSEVELAGKEANIAVEIGIDKDSFVLGCKGKDKDIYVSVPRADIENELEKSVFHPDSDSDYALTEEQYDSLLEMLELLDGKEDEADIKSLEKSYKKILKKVSKIVKPKSELKFFADGLNVSRKVTYVLDDEICIEIIDIIRDEADENEYLNKNLIPFESLGMVDSKGSKITSTKDFLKMLKKSMEDSSFDIELSYTECGGKIQQLEFAFSTKVGETRVSYEGEASFTYKKDSASVDLTIAASSSYQNSSAKQEIEIEYEKKTNKKTNDATITASVDLEGKVFDLEIEYDGKSSEYDLEISSEENTMSLLGKFALDPKKGTFNFSVDEMQNNGETVYEGNSIEISVYSTKEVPKIPSGEAILKMSDDEIETLIKDLQNILQ